MGSGVPLVLDGDHRDEVVTDTTGSWQMSGELLLVVALFCLQSALFSMLIGHQLKASAYLQLHLGLCTMAAASGLCWAWLWSVPERARQRTAILLHVTILTLLAGPFGTFIATALLVPRAGSTSLAESFTAESESGTMRHCELTRLELLHNTLLDRRVRLEHACDVRPLLDVVIEGTQTEKLNALGLISKRYVPGLAPAMKCALEDKDASVRVLAATVIAQQHSAHTRRIGALQAAAQAAPERSDNWQLLSQAHRDYAASGLLETSRAEAEERKAGEYLDRATRPGVTADQVLPLQGRMPHHVA